MTQLRKLCEDRGITFTQAVKAGIPKSRFSKHYYGVNMISAESALDYERILGIDRSELRPDLWPPVEKKDEGSSEPLTPLCESEEKEATKKPIKAKTTRTRKRSCRFTEEELAEMDEKAKDIVL